MVENGFKPTFAETQRARRHTQWEAQRANLAANPNAMNSYAEAATLALQAKHATGVMQNEQQTFSEQSQVVEVREIVRAPVVMTITA